MMRIGQIWTIFPYLMMSYSLGLLSQKLISHTFWQEADCHINFQNRFTINTEILLIVGVSTSFNGEVNEMSHPFENPIPDVGNYWEFSPILCQFLALEIEDGIVKGSITEEIREYPREFFNDKLEECDFDLQDLNEYRCADEDYIVFPNPNHNGKIRIKNSYDKPPISLIRVFDANGNFVQEHIFPFEIFFLNASIQINHQACIFYKFIAQNMLLWSRF